MTRRLFISGTDTDIGKTMVSCLLLRELQANGYSTAALKPVAAGTVENNGIRANEDALTLMRFCSKQYAYNTVNPIVFEEPIAPHIAAERHGQKLTVERCVALCQPMLQERPDYLLVEGAGGWLVPLNARETMADLALALQCDIVLVVGMRLGCINHALLSAQAIEQCGGRLAGWVANHVDPNMEAQAANLETIAQRINAPLLGQVPYLREGLDGVPQALFKLDLLAHC